MIRERIPTVCPVRSSVSLDDPEAHPVTGRKSTDRTSRKVFIAVNSLIGDGAFYKQANRLRLPVVI